MGTVLIKIWVFVLCVLDVMIFVQLAERALMYLRGRKDEADWTPYNKVMLTLLAVAFFPVTLCWLYITKD